MVAWGDQREATEGELTGLELSVDILNINVAKGDSALYLLIQHPAPNATDTKPFIHRAVLIDGGVKGTGAKAIRDVLNHAAKLYHFDREQGGRKKLAYPALDAIVSLYHGTLGVSAFLPCACSPLINRLPHTGMKVSYHPALFDWVSFD